MTNIIDALNKLDQSLGHLETACEKQERKIETLKATPRPVSSSQHDLFGGGSSNAQQHIDPALLAQKLDVAIERVETVLREG